MDSTARHPIIVFVAVAAVQAIGFPLISRVFGLGDRFQAPSWIVIILVSALIAFVAGGASREKSS
jgi:hypothetical protein